MYEGLREYLVIADEKVFRYQDEVCSLTRIRRMDKVMSPVLPYWHSGQLYNHTGGVQDNINDLQVANLEEYGNVLTSSWNVGSKRLSQNHDRQ